MRARGERVRFNKAVRKVNRVNHGNKIKGLVMQCGSIGKETDSSKHSTISIKKKYAWKQSKIRR